MRARAAPQKKRPQIDADETQIQSNANSFICENLRLSAA